VLSKIYRLPGSQIPLVLKKGKRSSFPPFNLVVLKPRASSLEPRASCFAFVVSSKISKKAVVRNRTKRLLSESVRLLMPQIKKGCDVMFFAKKPFLEEKLQDILPQVEKALKKVGILSLD